VSDLESMQDAVDWWRARSEQFEHECEHWSTSASLLREENYRLRAVLARLAFESSAYVGNLWVPDLQDAISSARSEELKT